MAQFIKVFNQDLRQDMRIRYGGPILYTGDSQANVLTVNLFDNGTPYSGGGTVSGTAIRNNGTTVPLTGGRLDGNVVSMPLIANCYSVPGPLSIFVNLTTSGVTATILSVVYQVVETESDSVIDPSGEITISVNTLLNTIETAKATVPAVADTLMAAIAPTYDELTYPISAGLQHCWYEGVLYVNLVDIASQETWTASHWQAVDLSGEIAPLKVLIQPDSDGLIVNL